MVQREIIEEFSNLGKIFAAVGEDLDLELTEKQSEIAQQFVVAAQGINRQNPWFREQEVILALQGISLWLDIEKLTHFCKDYHFTKVPKKVAIIMAGNIPLVGFHDFMCVLLSGNAAVCKPSSNDLILWNIIYKFFLETNPDLAARIQIVSGKLGGFDAIIATGSNNSSISFKHYFQNYPNLIRQSRTSIAVLRGDETPEDLTLLGSDIFSYFGFGCRNVTQVFLPKNMDIQRIFSQLLPYSDVQNHHKYMNNYDYYRALYLMNGDRILENGFVIFKESNSLHAPPSVVNFWYFRDVEEVEQILKEKKEEIQAVVGYKGTPFGSAQKPPIADFADGIDTMKFLETVI